MSVLWTIAPVEHVFSGLTSHSGSAQWQEIQVEGVTMLVSPAGRGMGRIERLISPNPQDYLRPEWQPGQLVPLYT
ncbi:MAG: YlzJ-like family protein [Alicyclobacillaceae bacterium]|nr:YlzJ-like family protein [Alicyclobacillaceae bacterium]